jgi:hypothetical protein
VQQLVIANEDTQHRRTHRIGTYASGTRRIYLAQLRAAAREGQMPAAITQNAFK